MSRGLAVGAAAMAMGLGSGRKAMAEEAASGGAATSSAGQFKLKYAPHFGMFENLAGKDPFDQLKFIADQGFTAFEDNGMMNQPPEFQEKFAKEMDRLGLEMGVFVAHGDFGAHTFVHDKDDIRATLAAHMNKAVETAKRVNAKWCTVVTDAYDPQMQWDYQTANVIENLRRCAEICEPTGLVMVLEPLNFHDHPGLFLSRVEQGYQICRAVNSPSCKILDDLYHSQIQEGNLIPNMDQAWSEIAYFQMGDNPGRNEPTTGEINYKNVFKHIHDKGYTGILGMEHGNSKKGKDGELAVIRAYREVDSF